MHLLKIILLLTLVVPSSSFWSVSSVYEKLKEHIENILRTQRNGTLSEADSALIENLTSHWGEMVKNDVERNRKWLGHFRGKVLEKLKEADHASPELKKQIKQIIRNTMKKRRDHIRKSGDNLMEVNEKANVSGNFYQGDILLSAEQQSALDPTANSKEKRQAYRDRFYPSTTWGTTLYYSLNSNLPSKTRRVAELAIRFWQSNTCVNFVNSPTASQRVEIFSGDGCYSYVGRIGGVQELSLGRGCDSVGTAAHEFGHALGFFHEQSRHDRDNAITVATGNIVSNYVDQFDKETTSTNNNYGLPYDYGSVMQYGATSASSNNQPTMVAKLPQYQDTMGSDIVSFIDVSMMNNHYNCKARCASSGTVCQNGGFPHPRDCRSCLCPAGYGGRLCNERPTGCGATLQASSTVQTLSSTVGNGDRTLKDEFVYCNWLIQAPAGKRIQARVTSYSPSACIEGCIYGGIELKWLANPIQTGSRYCCTNDVNSVVTSQSNVLPIVAFNRYARDSFTITYVAF